MVAWFSPGLCAQARSRAHGCLDFSGFVCASKVSRTWSPGFPRVCVRKQGLAHMVAWIFPGLCAQARSRAHGRLVFPGFVCASKVSRTWLLGFFRICVRKKGLAHMVAWIFPDLCAQEGSRAHGRLVFPGFVCASKVSRTWSPGFPRGCVRKQGLAHMIAWFSPGLCAQEGSRAHGRLVFPGFVCARRSRAHGRLVFPGFVCASKVSRTWSPGFPRVCVRKKVSRTWSPGFPRICVRKKGLAHKVVSVFLNLSFFKTLILRRSPL